jgi:hypothetical protein
MWNELIWLRIATAAGSCEHDNETLGLIKDGEFGELPSDR